jgi:16S rRNA (guanine966-N2)-methyltransferase
VSGRGVRITGGAFRGRGLTVPAGARPTEGRVREALFSIWRDRLAGSRFLDLFAGSGAVGIEAAGRGALWVVCVDQDVTAIRAILGNVARVVGERTAGAGAGAAPIGVRAAGPTGAREAAPTGAGAGGPTGGLVEVRRLTLPAGLARLGATGESAAVPGRSGAGLAPAIFDLVFADPPYRFDAFEPLLLGLPPLLAPAAEVAVEHSTRRQLPASAGALVRTDLRRYGESALAFYRAPE